MALILDTSALVALERSPSPLTLSDALANEPVFMPAIVWAEALIGVRMASRADKAARRRAKLAAIHEIAHVIPFDDRIAEHYADIYYECAGRGQMIPQNDMAVAATARALKAAVLVGPKDEAHFRMVKNLNVVVLT